MSVLVPSNLICMVQDTLKSQPSKIGELMNRLISAISDFISKALALAVTCSVVAFLQWGLEDCADKLSPVRLVDGPGC